LLLAQVKNQLSFLPPPDPMRPTLSTEQQAAEEKRKRLVNLLAEIEKRINSENARPKKRYVSPSTQEKPYAIYYESLKRAIEDRGTENFPETGGKKLYGELTMIVHVNHDGHLLKTEIVESSGDKNLDRRAEAIARSAGPFGPFTSAMRASADQIVVVSRFKFTRDATLETRLGAQ
jgi:protein TonB